MYSKLSIETFREDIFNIAITSEIEKPRRKMDLFHQKLLIYLSNLQIKEDETVKSNKYAQLELLSNLEMWKMRGQLLSLIAAYLKMVSQDNKKISFMTYSRGTNSGKIRMIEAILRTCERASYIWDHVLIYFIISYDLALNQFFEKSGFWDKKINDRFHFTILNYAKSLEPQCLKEEIPELSSEHSFSLPPISELTAEARLWFYPLL